MSIQSENRKSGPFYGDGRVARFPFDFKVFQAPDVRVTLRSGNSERSLLYGSDYQVSLQADQEMDPGGEVLLKTPPAVGEYLVITSAMSYIQPAKFTNQGGFYPTVLNDSLDRLTILVQQILQQMNRMPRFGVTTDEAVDTTLPFPAPRHGIGWNETGTRLVNTRYHIEAEQSAAEAAEAANRSQTAQSAAHQSATNAQTASSLAQAASSDASASRTAAQAAASYVIQKAEEINQKFPVMQAHAEQAKRSAAQAGTDSDRAQAAADLAQSLANGGAGNLNSIKLGNGRSNGYQEVLFGNYQRSPGNGNYGGVFNGTFAGGSVRWMSLSNFSENGQHLSSLWADAEKAYLRIGSTNHELATKGTTLAHYGIAGNQELIGGRLTIKGREYPSLALQSTLGDSDLWLESSGSRHYFIRRGRGRTSGGDILYLPNRAGTLATLGTTLAHYGITDAAGRADVEQAAPPGTVMYFAGRNPPPGWLKANGAAVSRTTYAPLFAAIGTTYGSGDGRTTFNLPDLRGEFVRGWDDGRGVDSGRAVGSAQGGQMEYHAHFIANNQHGGEGIVGTDLTADTYMAAYTTHGAVERYGLRKAAGNATANVGKTSFSGGWENQSENRPRNVALLVCIKI